MFSWLLCVSFAVIFYSKSTMSCSYDSDCFGSETCCSNGVCRSDCSYGISNVVVIIVVIIAVVGKVVFWIFCCYCWRRRQSPGVIIHRVNTPGNVGMAGTTEMTPTASQGYPTHSQAYTNPYPSSNTTPDYMYKNQDGISTDSAVNAPPAYKNDSYP